MYFVNIDVEQLEPDNCVPTAKTVSDEEAQDNEAEAET